MNTSKQVNVMIGLLFVFLVGTLLYFIWDGVRADDAEERQIAVNAERGGELFAINCRVCHGPNGLGVLENPNLPGAPLNLEDFRPADNPGRLLELQNRFRDTIRCGRVGTLMPPWAEDQGGALNDFQIEQLVTLITGAQPNLAPPDNPNAVSELGWEAAHEEAEHADILEGKELARAVGAEDIVLVLTDAQELFPDSLLRIGEEVVKVIDAPSGAELQEKVTDDQTEFTVERAGDLFRPGDLVQVDDELMEVVSVSDEALEVERGVDGTEAKSHSTRSDIFEPSDELIVERGAFSTDATEHEEGTQVYAGPLEPPEGPLLGVDGTPPCGQLGVTAPAPGGEPVPIEGDVTLEMGDNLFSLDGESAPVLGVAVGQEVTIDLVNNGNAVHNMHIAGPGNTYGDAFCKVGGDEPCSDPDTMLAGDTGSISFQFAEAGTFDFRCDFHPLQMTGQIVVE